MSGDADPAPPPSAAARAHFDQYCALRTHAMDAQAGYGRWIISSLLLLHSGSIFLTAQSDKMREALQAGAIWWFLAGIVLALCGAWAAWWNFTLAAQVYSDFAHRIMPLDPAQPTEDDADRIISSIGSTMRISVSCCVFSILCLVGGAVAIRLQYP